MRSGLKTKMSFSLNNGQELWDSESSVDDFLKDTIGLKGNLQRFSRHPFQVVFGRKL